MGRAGIGLVMTVFGIFNASGAFILGKLSDVIGRKTIIYFGSLCTLFCAISIRVSESTLPHAWLFVVAAVWGLADAAWNTVLSALLSATFPDQITEAYSTLRLFQHVAVAISFYTGDRSYLNLKLDILLGLILIGLICFQINLYFFRLETRVPLTHSKAVL